MLVVFGDGKCPMCGDAGKRIEKKAFHCVKCDVAYDEVLIFSAAEIRDFYDKYWN